jgi:hypothetical protein
MNPGKHIDPQDKLGVSILTPGIKPGKYIDPQHKAGGFWMGILDIGFLVMAVNVFD